MFSGNGDLSLLIANIVAGALVGYVTKALAINMLFKEYPIVGGAEIIKDRENLEISMSTLVEEKLIKPSTMLEEFQKEEFKVSFENLLNHIVENTLKENIQEIKSLSEIEGVKVTSDNLYKFLNTKRENILEICIEILFNNIQIEDILSKEQLSQVVDKLILILSSVFFNNYGDIFAKFVNEFDDVKISDIVSDEIFLKIINDIEAKHFNFLSDSNFQNKIEAFIYKALELIELDELIINLEKDIKNKTLIQLLAKSSQDEFLDYLIENIKKLLSSEKGKIIVKDFLINFINILEELDIPLSAFISEQIEIKVLELVEKYLPDLLIKGEEWIALNKLEVQKLINESIEEHLESENIIKQVIGNIFAQNLTEKYKIVESTIDEIKKMAIKAGPDIIKIANRFLNNTNINDIAKYAKKNFLDYDALTEIVIEIVSDYISKIDKKLFDKVLNTKISNLSIIENLDFKTIVNKHLVPSFIEHLKNESEKVLEDNSKDKINSFLLKRFKTISDKKVSELFQTKNIDGFAVLLNEFIDFETLRPIINQNLIKAIPEIIKNKSINQVVNNNIKKDIYYKMTDFYESRITSILDILSKEKLLNIYQKTASIYGELSKNRIFSKQLTDTLINLMVNLIRDNKLFDGKIYVVVKESFKRFSDDELKDEMNSFMGKELEPIKLLGAFLGAIVGIFMYYLSFVPGYGQYVTGYAALISYPLAYAITEMGTNWLAIRMLFKPYQQKRILGINLPFTPGVFPKNKKALADSMVNFIDKKLLSKDNMVQILEKYHLKWKEVIKGVVSKNNYQVIDETINRYAKENYDTVSPVILEVGFNEINKNRDEISKYLVEEVKNIDLTKIDLENTKKEIYLQIDQTDQLVKNYLANNLLNITNMDKTLKDIIADDKTELISNKLSKFLFSTLQKTLQNPKTIYSILDNYDYLLDKKIDEIISSEILLENKTNFINFAITNIKDESIQESAIKYFNEKILKSNLSSNKSIGELFDGKLVNLILKESGSLMGYFSKYIHSLAINKKDEIVKVILTDVEKKGIVETMLVRFAGVKNDVKGIVDVLVDNKLEVYISEKESEIHQIFNSYVKSNVSNIKLSDLGITDDIFDKNNLKKLIKAILSSHQFIKIVDGMLGKTLEDISKNMTLKEIIQTIDFNSLNQLADKFSPELDQAINHLNNKINKNKTQLFDLTSHQLSDTMKNYLFTIPFSELIKPDENLKNNIDLLIDKVYKSNTFSYSKQLITNQAIEKFNTNITHVIDYPVLQKDISNMIYTLTLNNENYQSRSSTFKNNIKSSVKDITISFVEVLNENVERETKKVVENIMVNSLVDSLRINNREVMEPVNFEAIVRKEIDKMDPARIEALFDFAKPVFRLLVWYGALGGIIGLAVGIFEAFR